MLHYSVAIVAARLARRQAQIDEGVVLAESLGKVLDALPLDPVHVEVEIDDVTGSIEGFSDRSHSFVTKLVKAQVVGRYPMVEHHELSGQNLRRIRLKVAIGEV